MINLEVHKQQSPISANITRFRDVGDSPSFVTFRIVVRELTVTFYVDTVADLKPILSTLLLEMEKGDVEQMA